MNKRLKRDANKFASAFFSTLPLQFLGDWMNEKKFTRNYISWLSSFDSAVALVVGVRATMIIIRRSLYWDE